jgi:hypothetical protein
MENKTIENTKQKLLAELAAVGTATAKVIYHKSGDSVEIRHIKLDKSVYVHGCSAINGSTQSVLSTNFVEHSNQDKSDQDDKTHYLCEQLKDFSLELIACEDLGWEIDGEGEGEVSFDVRRNLIFLIHRQINIFNYTF